MRLVVEPERRQDMVAPPFVGFDGGELRAERLQPTDGATGIAGDRFGQRWLDMAIGRRANGCRQVRWIGQYTFVCDVKQAARKPRGAKRRVVRGGFEDDHVQATIESPVGGR
jgi:hypothetical protein